MMISGLRAVYAVVLLSLSHSLVSAQLIPIKTVPIAQGDQFQIFPSNNIGMASVSIALPDSLQDPFSNPATGRRVKVARFFSAPTVYSVSRGAGGGRSLPLAVLARKDTWFGGFALALQQVDPSRPPGSDGFAQPLPPPPLPGVDTGPVLPGPNDHANGNRYVFGMLGKSLPARGLAVGVSVLWTGLHGIDGVDLLYAGSRRVDQTGHAVDVRLGVLKEWNGARTLEAVVLHNRFAATHDVTYADSYWDPGTQSVRLRPRFEENNDKTNTWGLHLKYALPLSATGWRIGWVGTINRMSHPKIPEYELANVPAIPRDPGYSTALNIGMGFGRSRGAATFGVDMIYEPIRSYTWADAAAPVVNALGDTLAAGAKTVENRFNFSNALLRIGAGQEVELSEGAPGRAAGWQLGLVVRSIRYRLRQTDNVQLASREFDTGWLEWTPTWGLSLRYPDFELRYRGRVTKGAGRPGFSQFLVGVRDLALAGNSILAAPAGPLFLTDVNTTTHQISLSLPLR